MVVLILVFIQQLWIWQFQIVLDPEVGTDSSIVDCFRLYFHQLEKEKTFLILVENKDAKNFEKKPFFYSFKIPKLR